MSRNFCKSIPDFEKALIAAMLRRFPDAIEKMCIFHLFKAFFTNVQKKGLLELYNDYSKPEIRTLLRCLPSLAYLPLDEVVDGYGEICEALSDLIPTVIAAEWRPKLHGNDSIVFFYVNPWLF